MAWWTALKTSINNLIKDNDNNEITGTILNQVLTAVIDNLGGYTAFRGIALPATNPGTPAGPVFYIMGAEGVYSNFGGITSDGTTVSILTNVNGDWEKQDLSSGITVEVVQPSPVVKVSVNNIQDGDTVTHLYDAALEIIGFKNTTSGYLEMPPTCFASGQTSSTFVFNSGLSSEFSSETFTGILICLKLD